MRYNSQYVGGVSVHLDICSVILWCQVCSLPCTICSLPFFRSVSVRVGLYSGGISLSLSLKYVFVFVCLRERERRDRDREKGEAPPDYHPPSLAHQVSAGLGLGASSPTEAIQGNPERGTRSEDRKQIQYQPYLLGDTHKDQAARILYMCRGPN